MTSSILRLLPSDAVSSLGNKRKIDDTILTSRFYHVPSWRSQLYYIWKNKNFFHQTYRTFSWVFFNYQLQYILLCRILSSAPKLPRSVYPVAIAVCKIEVMCLTCEWPALWVCTNYLHATHTHTCFTLSHLLPDTTSIVTHLAYVTYRISSYKNPGVHSFELSKIYPASNQGRLLFKARRWSPESLLLNRRRSPGVYSTVIWTFAWLLFEVGFYSK